jgi:hypothetical protein
MMRSALALALSVPLIAIAADEMVRAVHLDLSVSLAPQARTLTAKTAIVCECGGPLTLSLGLPFVVERLTIDGVSSESTVESGNEQKRFRIELPPSLAQHRIELTYHGELQPLVEQDERGVLGGLPAMASERGSFLPAGSGWYPELSVDTFTYRLDIELPQGQRALAPGQLVQESDDAHGYRAQFELMHPAQGIDLVAGPYTVNERMAGNVRVRTFFHSEIAQLATAYLEAAAGFIDRYSKSIAPYPYTAFSIVSSPLPTGFGMPAFTYLGIDVLKLPFIRSTSLGHEVLHNWWGNGVYVDWQQGNWSEGLTAFMADYAYKESESEAAAREMRLSWLRDFAALPEQRDQPLREFTSRAHDASQIVGYDKAAFLFLMLRDEIGSEAFAAGLRRFFEQGKFRRASWSDLEHAFAKASGRDLHAFFAQWLDRRGAPSIGVQTASASAAGKGYRIDLMLTQRGTPYALRLPIAVQTDRGVEEKIVRVQAREQALVLETAERPRSMTIDPQLRVFRRLHADEIPPIVRQVTLDPSTVTVIASKGDEFEPEARQLAKRLMDTDAHFVERMPADASVILIGLTADVDARLKDAHLAPRPREVSDRGSAQVWTAPLENGKTLLAISARDAAALQALLRPLPHYGRQSWLVFDGAKAVDRGVWEVGAVSWRFE